MNTKLLGDFGEKLAAAYLKNKGYEIVECNFRVAGGEIDIIMRSPSHQLVFVEVKTRTSDSFGHGDESIGTIKTSRMEHAIHRFLQGWPRHEKNTVHHRDPDYQIDVIEIEPQENSRPRKFIITHLEDIEL